MIFIRFLRFAFHLLYHQLAWTYDGVAAVVSAGMWTSWVRSIEPQLDGCERILEIGPGPGHLLEALHTSGRSPVGVDLSSQMVRQAHRRLRRAGMEPRLVRADARQLPFPNRSFDAVVATFPAEYIAETRTWLSLRRVLNRGGRIVVLVGAVPSGYHPLRFASRLLFRLTRQDSSPEVAHLRDRMGAFFDEAGLVGKYETGFVGKSETYVFTATRKPAV